MFEMEYYLYCNMSWADDDKPFLRQETCWRCEFGRGGQTKCSSPGQITHVFRTKRHGVSVECHASSISRIDRRALGWLFRAAFRSLWASSRYCVAGY